MPTIEALKRWGYQNDGFEGKVVKGQRLEVEERRARFLERKGRAARLDAKGNKLAPESPVPLDQTDSGHDVRVIRQAPVASLPSEVSPASTAAPLAPSQPEGSRTGARRDLSSSSARGQAPQKSRPKSGRKSAGAKKTAKRKSSR